MSKAWPVPGIAPSESLAENARRILAVRTAEFFSYTPIVALPEAVEELHALRIAAKRLRYTLELFRDVFGDRGEAVITQVKAFQEDLGEIHDHDVRLDLIAAELDALAASPSDTPEPSTGQRVPATSGQEPPSFGLRLLADVERTARQDRYDAFLARWRAESSSMRRELVALSALLV